jgi:hypothetical protein
MDRNFRINRWLNDHGLSELILVAVGVATAVLLVRLPWPWAVAGVVPAAAFVGSRAAYYYRVAQLEG